MFFFIRLQLWRYGSLWSATFFVPGIPGTFGPLKKNPSRLICISLVCLNDLEAVVLFDSTFLSEPSTLIFTCFPIVLHFNVIWEIFIRVPRQAVANVTHWVQNGPHCGTSSSYSRLTLSETTMASKLASTSLGWDFTQTCSSCPALPEFSPSSTVLSRGNTIYQGQALFFNITWEGGRGQVLQDIEFFPWVLPLSFSFFGSAC